MLRVRLHVEIIGSLSLSKAENFRVVRIAVCGGAPDISVPDVAIPRTVVAGTPTDC